MSDLHASLSTNVDFLSKNVEKNFSSNRSIARREAAAIASRSPREKSSVNGRIESSSLSFERHGGSGGGQPFFFRVHIHDSEQSRTYLLVSSLRIRQCCDEIMEEVSSDRWPETKSLRDDEKLYKTVEKLFISSIKRFSPGTTITSIHRCLHTTPSGNSRLLSFGLQKRAAMEARGNANVKFEWHGASSSSIATIISQGFRKTNSRQLGLSSHGLDIHLSQPHSPYVSALLSEADEDGERHVMLCRIIMGNSEKVEAGSKQDRPSNEGFDSGIDDPVNPKWYVVWNTNMNKHIIPVYLVSFKSSSHSSGERKLMGARKLSNRPLCRLFTEIRMRLPSSKMQALKILYNQYRVN
ncbi:putative inactive poly [ADP-ribose] polymerase SRO1 [Platanthera guangdongensis]|uniref:Inactive poly [ADP-ribose] polymerase SRO1 n=1 Tax=Platanthera guangdongensis TaxID=2320717 RepID=A0ABR2M3B1_9ASPA